jgi:site-specific DNA-methyltransferase (adenine-specific)/adenine-specific DNA-methyltransferase
MTKEQKDYIINLIQEGKELPEDFKYQLFPTIQKEYELAYAGKMRKEDILANEDGALPVPLQIEKVFNGNEYEAFDDGWKNIIAFGDNLQLLKTIYENKDPLIKDKIKGKVKLIYIDPPFATEGDFSGQDGQKAYSDKSKGSDFIEFLRRRLILAKEILADDGSIFVHLDNKKGHYIKVLMDEIFGENNFLNQIIWHFRTYQGQTKNYYPRKHNVIFWYKNKISPKFELMYDDDYEDTVDAQRWNKYIVNGNEIRGSKYPKNDSRFMAYYNRWVQDNGRKPQNDDIIHKIEGYVVDDVWTDIQAIDPKDKTEKVGYPTQKPEQLLKRIIESTTNENDIVLDFFGGSGVTMETAEKLGRKWVTCDLGKLSFFTMQKRILQIQNSKSLDDPKKKYSKKAKSFITASLGSYDLEKTFELERAKYVDFVSGLFKIKSKKYKISGFEFEGKKDDAPVIIFDYEKHKDSSVDENYLNDIHKHIGNKVGSRVYIVAPINFIDFVDDFIEIEDVRYYFLKIPYHIINELHKKPFVKMRQPQSKSRVNNIEEAIGFHFKRPPEVKAEIKREEDSVKIIIHSFKTTELQSDKTKEEKSFHNFETFSAVFIDKDYNGKSFEMDESLFADDLLPKKPKNEESLVEYLRALSKTGIEITLKNKEVGKQIMIVFTDIFGNDFTQTFIIE